jgi:hypothetical protein
VLVLLTARLTNREDPGNKHIAGVTVGTETAFAPEHRRAQRAFGRVVRRLDPVDGDKGLEGGFEGGNVGAE